MYPCHVFCTRDAPPSESPGTAQSNIANDPPPTESTVITPIAQSSARKQPATLDPPDLPNFDHLPCKDLPKAEHDAVDEWENEIDAEHRHDPSECDVRWHGEE